MSPNTPAIHVALLSQPVVTKDLCVEVDGLKRGVVDVGLRSLKEEETVVIDRFRAPA